MSGWSHRNTRLAALFLVLGSCVGCDQASKRVAAEMLKGESTRSFLGDTFRLTYTENPGAFLGLGGGWPEPLRWLIFNVGALAVALIALHWVYARLREGTPLNLSVWAMVLIGAGGIGNLVDRLWRDGRVIDFMNLGVGSLRTGIFNVADVQIMVGLGLMLLSPRKRGPDPQASG